MGDDKVELIISANAKGLTSGLQDGEKRLKGFSGVAKRELDNIGNATRSLQKQLAALGLSIGAGALIRQSAEVDRSLVKIKQTAEMTTAEMQQLRKELFGLAGASGQAFEGLQSGFNTLIAGGLEYKESLETIKAINVATAVTGAEAETLANALMVANAAFKFDLSQPGLALELLDKMTVSGRKGKAELEALASIYGRVGVNASASGMSNESTLALVEVLSLIEGSPELLATLTDSTMRLFTNMKHMQNVQAKTGVKFFDAEGSRRDAVDVLEDISKKYKTLNTEKQQAEFIQKTFGNLDLKTQKSIRILLSEGNIEKLREFETAIKNAGGTLNRDFDEATKNAIDQTRRLASQMREAADAFIQPLNKWIGSGMKKVLDPKEKGGLDISGGEMIGGTAAALAASYGLYRFGGPAIKKLLGRAGGTATGIAEGKAIEAATGVTPVFVTNWPGGMGMEALGSIAGKGGLGNLGAIKGAVGKAGALGAAGMVGWEFGSFLNKGIDAGVQGLTGGKNASFGEWLYDKLHPDQAALISALKDTKQPINISVAVDQNGQVTTTADNMGTTVNVDKRGKF